MRGIAADADCHCSRLILPRIVGNNGNKDNLLQNRNMIGILKSWDSLSVSGFPNSANAFASYRNGGTGNNDLAGKMPFSFFSNSFWDNGDDDNGAYRNKRQWRQNADLTWTSKLWDEGRNDKEQKGGGYGGVSCRVDDNLVTSGMWRDQSLFSGSSRPLSPARCLMA